MKDFNFITLKHSHKIYYEYVGIVRLKLLDWKIIISLNVVDFIQKHTPELTIYAKILSRHQQLEDVYSRNQIY